MATACNPERSGSSSDTASDGREGAAVYDETDQDATPRTFVLVHGAWRGGWCYARVAEILRARGHRIFTPTLAGLADHSAALTSTAINCSTHVQQIIDLLKWEQLAEVVLCGHSYGGMVITAVADAAPERIASLVYVDALIPQSGMSVLDHAQPDQVVELLRKAGDHGGHWLPPEPAAAFNVNPTDRAMVNALCTPHPLATFIERLRLTGAYTQISKKTYVLATGWQGTPLTRRLYQHAKQDQRWMTAEVQCGHDVMLDAPEQLAKILLHSR